MKVIREGEGFKAINIRIESQKELEMMWDIINHGMMRDYLEGRYLEEEQYQEDTVDFRHEIWKELEKHLPGGRKRNK